MAQPQLPCQQRVIAVTQRNEGYPPKSANHVLLQKIIKYHFMATFFQPHWTRFVTSSDHHSATRGKAGPAAFALRNIFAKGLGEDRIDAANLPEASCSLRGLGVKNSKKKDEKHNSSTKKSLCLKTEMPNI
jgi:hypothetical protein